MPWYLRCLNCACEPATTKGEEGKEESVKWRGKKQWQADGKKEAVSPLMKENGCCSFGVLRIKVLVSSLTSSFIPNIYCGSKSWGLCVSSISRIWLLLPSLLLYGPSGHHLLPSWGHWPPERSACSHPAPLWSLLNRSHIRWATLSLPVAFHPWWKSSSYFGEQCLPCKIHILSAPPQIPTSPPTPFWITSSTFLFIHCAPVTFLALPQTPRHATE